MNTVSAKSLPAALALSALVALSACATKIQPGADKVRVVSGPQVAACESLGIVQADRQIGDSKDNERSTLNQAINEVAKRGGNGIFVMSTGSRGFDGTTITAEALRCPN